MTLAKLVVKNITRRRGRFVFTLLGITIGIASFVTFLSLGGNLKNEIHRESAALGANLIVTPKGSCAYEQVSILTGEQLPTTITMDEVAKICAIKGLTAVPFLTEKTAISNKPVAVNGILPAEMKAFKGWEMDKGAYFSAHNEPGAVVGAVAARQFKLQPGSFITVRGEQLPVKGVLKESGGRDDITIFLSLPVAQRLFKAVDRVSYVAIKVDDLTLIDSYILKIKEAVSLAMMAATYERKREIGILQALGAKQGTIFTIFMLESGFYGLIGGVSGVLGGLFCSVVAAPYISQNAFTSFVKGSGTGSMLDPGIIVGSIAFSTAVAILAGLYPAWRAARLSPVEAISYE